VVSRHDANLILVHDVLQVCLSVGLIQTTLHGCIAMCNMVDNFEPEASLGAGGTVGEEISGRILIIDDDPHFLRILQRILSGEKFQVTTTANPCEALGLLRSSNFNLIICDLRMPDCDGLNLLQAIRGAGDEIPVIILTAYGEVDTYLEAMNAGATEYLNKPIKSDELLLAVRSCLRRGNNRRNNKQSHKV